jgi:hypothetical protein
VHKAVANKVHERIRLKPIARLRSDSANNLYQQCNLRQALL